MKLADYLKKHNLSDAEFSARTGIERVAVWAYRTGRRQPRADKVAEIEKATHGLVRAKDFRRAA